jgi:hypothetical protein
MIVSDTGVGSLSKECRRLNWQQMDQDANLSDWMADPDLRHGNGRETIRFYKIPKIGLKQRSQRPLIGG